MNPAEFDRELTLPEVVRGLPLDRVAAALEMLVGTSMGIEDTSGRIVAGHAVPGGQTTPFQLEIEPVGQVRLPAGMMPQGVAAASLVQLLLQTRAQVLRAGDLHASAMSADYDELRERHAALQQSEARYRELSQVLEERVQEQVKLLDERQRQLYLAERLAAIGQLAAGVAHEINNPIGFIHSNLESGQRYLPKLRELKAAAAGNVALQACWQQLDLDFVIDDLGDLMRDCISGADRIARIVRDLKGFSNIDRPEAEDVDLNAQLASVVSVFMAGKPTGVQITERYQNDLPRVLCLPGHLNQVFVNLLNNAMQAVEKQAHAAIEISTRRDDTHLMIDITDNGPGIKPDVMPRVFDPFFTTRGVGQGTGLGLTVARDIVGAHDGTLQLICPPGRGTTARVRLPLS